MSEYVGAGLRERKKLKTRATLVAVAAELCQRQGFDNTTVEQIAAAADVSPRTFSRYFPTKADVVAALADDMDDYVTEALRRQPAGITAYEALLRAHLEIFARRSGHESPAFTRMAVLISIVNGATSMTTSPFAFKQRHTGTSVEAIAERLGVRLSDPMVALVADVWTLLFSSSFAGLGMPGQPPIESGVLCERLSAAFDTFRGSWESAPEPVRHVVPHASGPQR
ncbi:MAG: TetR family transcriptional regulator [Mycolicibacterium cosmeticum]|nr:TetR family transcriptional regulator [Mycolicibacterium cosmeticum]